jgi:hypothetical protein
MRIDNEAHRHRHNSGLPAHTLGKEDLRRHGFPLFITAGQIFGSQGAVGPLRRCLAPGMRDLNAGNDAARLHEGSDATQRRHVRH